MFAHGETVTRLRRLTATDPYSGESAPIPWDKAGHTPASASIDGCGFDPGGSVEPVEVGRVSVVTKPTVYAPYGSDILVGDRLVVRNVTYDVDGTPASWRSPFTGWEPGLVVELKAVSG